MSSSEEKSKTDLTYKHRTENASRHLDIDKNPCVKEQEMSFQCLEDNGYDRSKCSKQFLNYKNCRQFWQLVERDRRRKGIEPCLPAAKDRVQAREEYKHIMSWS